MPCINIHVTPGRLDLEFLLESDYSNNKKKKKVLNEAGPAAGAAALGHCGKKDTGKL